MSPDTNSIRFKNGIRLIHRLNSSEVAHLGLIVHTGTRDEEKEEHGLAHFMEHMFFKGTGKRSAYQIISRLEDVGGEVNAYTTKEETALYASFLKQDHNRAMELLQDIFLHSAYPEEELEKEAEVIASEIQAYEDSPSDLIFDRAEEVLFPKHAIGRNILGTEQSLANFKRDSLLAFLKSNYATNELVISFVGSVPFNRIKASTERYFGSLPGKERFRARNRPHAMTGHKSTEQRETYQTHCMLVGEAFALPDPDRLSMYLLNNMLGGPGMNSRLNLALRERKGLTYSAESHYTPYTDTGAFMLYFSCDPEKFDLSHKIALEEMKKFRNRPVPDRTFFNAKKQLLGQLAISRENNEHLMLTAGKSHLIFDHFSSIEEIRKKLDAITASRVMEVANRILQPKHMNLLVFKK